MSDFVVPHVFGDTLTLNIEGGLVPHLYTYQPYAALRDGQWYPGVRTLRNNVFVSAQEWDLGFDNKRVTLTFAYDFAKTMYEHERESWQAFIDAMKR